MRHWYVKMLVKGNSNHSAHIRTKIMRLNPFNRKNDPPENDELLNAIVVLASKETPHTLKKYYKALLKSKLLLAADSESLPDPILFVDNDGGIILPMFTDFKRLHTAVPDVQRYSHTPLPELCRIALSRGIFKISINPENGPGTYLSHHEIEVLAMGQIPDTSDISAWDDNPNFIPMGDPKLPTEDELNTITDYAASLLKRQSNVLAGYLILMKSSDDESTLTIAIEFNEQATETQKMEFTRKFVPALEKRVQRHMRAIWLEGEQLESVRSRVKPFYRQ